MKKKGAYPIIKFPERIQNYRNGKIEELIPYPKPEYPDKERFKLGSLIFPLVLIPISYYFFNHNIVIGIFFSILFIVNILILIGDNNNKRKKWKNDLANYNKSLEKHKSSVEETSILLEELNTKEKKDEFIANRIQRIAQQIQIPQLLEINIAAKGASEKYFLNVLKEVFGENIYTNLTSTNKGFSLPFVPDFVFYDNKILIDIEIDEPYVFKTGEPIHYWDELCKKHIDKDRDSFFLQKNWMVLRFTEKQVALNALGCCRIIANVVKLTTGNAEYINELTNVKKIKRELFWTKKDAKKLYDDRFRESYKIKYS